MKVKQLQSGPVRSFAVVCDPGDEAFDSLTRFARENELTAAHAAVGEAEHDMGMHLRAGCAAPRSGRRSR